MIYVAKVSLKLSDIFRLTYMLYTMFVHEMTLVRLELWQFIFFILVNVLPFFHIDHCFVTACVKPMR